MALFLIKLLDAQSTSLYVSVIKLTFQKNTGGTAHTQNARLKEFCLNLVILLVTISTLALNTWAACESQQESLKKWTEKCELATTGAVLTCLAATAAAPATSGASLSVCFTASAVRDKQCGIVNHSPLAGRA